MSSYGLQSITYLESNLHLRKFVGELSSLLYLACIPLDHLVIEVELEEYFPLLLLRFAF